MKVKRKLALTLAIMSAFSIMPGLKSITPGSEVFASEAKYSWMSNVVKVSKDTILNNETAPIVAINEDFGAWNKDHSIYLTVKGGEWTDAVLQGVLEVKKKDGELIDPVAAMSLFQITRDNKNTIVVTKKTDSKDSITLRIPMLVKVDNTTKDELTLKIEGESTGVRDAVHTFATLSDSKISIKFDEKTDIVNFADRGAKINPIKVEENFVGALKKGDKIKLEISRGFEWDNSYTTGPAISLRDSNNNYLSFKYDERESDETLMVMEVESIDANRKTRLSFEIKDLKIITEERYSTDYGKVTVYISGEDIKSESLNVAAYVNYGADVEVKKEIEFFSGRKITLPVVTLKENVKDSIVFNRPLDIEFPEWVNVIGIKSAKLDGKDVSAQFEQAFEISSSRLSKVGKDKKIVSYGTVTLTPDETNKELKLEVEFEIETKANTEGDIDITFSGRALGNEEIVKRIGSLKPVITIDTELTKLDVGLKDQEVGKIVISETEKGSIEKGYILVKFEDFTYGKWATEPTVTVVEGKLKLGRIKLLSDGILSIEIKSTSREKSIIEITDGVMTTSRSIADGEYDIDIFGSAIIDTNLIDSELEKGYSSSYITVGDKAEEALIKPQVKFTIGETSYMVDGKTFEMDAAPYVSKDSRTMVPVRYIAEAIGVHPQNILWDADSQVVTIFKDGYIAQIVVNTDTIIINGMEVKTDTKSVIQNGRTFLPISWIARVLDLPAPAWDGIAETVTFN